MHPFYLHQFFYYLTDYFKSFACLWQPSLNQAVFKSVKGEGEGFCPAVRCIPTKDLLKKEDLVDAKRKNILDQLDHKKTLDRVATDDPEKFKTEVWSILRRDELKPLRSNLLDILEGMLIAAIFEWEDRLEDCFGVWQMHQIRRSRFPGRG